MNSYLTFENHKVAIELPLVAGTNYHEVMRYIANNFLQYSFVDEHGRREVKEGVGCHHTQSDLTKWGYTIIPLI